MKLIKIASTPEVGLWWLYKGRILSYSIPYTQAEGNGQFLCVNLEHKQIWDEIRSPYLEEFPELSEKSFDEVPRGRVWFYRTKNYFTITCHEDIKSDPASIKKIMNAFGLNSREVQVFKDSQYKN